MVKGHKIHIGIVATRFNQSITEALLDSCISQLKSAGLSKSQITTVWVPGALEVPLVAQQFALRKDIQAVICLGAVIRGDTYHFEIVANESARGMMDVALSTGKPILNGILTTETVAQANQRARQKGGTNKGRDCAQAALEMISICDVVLKRVNTR